MPSRLKIVHIGAGGYVFAPNVVRDLIARHRLEPSELCLVDVNEEALDAMAGFARAMAEQEGVDCRVTATTERREVLEGADFVICSAAPEGARRWTMDYEVLRREGIADQARECGGLGGLVNACRAIALVLGVARDMEALCPDAKLLDVTNPMPRVVTAVRRFTSIECFGFCNIAWRGPVCRHLKMDRGYRAISDELDIPLDDLDVVSAGLNHFAWFVSARGKSTGRDLSDDVRAILYETGSHSNFPLLRKWCETYGAIGMSGTHHPSEYLAFDPMAHYSTSPPYHGKADQRAEAIATLAAVGAGDKPWRALFDLDWYNGSLEHPIDLIEALWRDRETRFEVLNLPNEGAMPDLPRGRVVETPALVSDGRVTPAPVGPLPGRAGELCRAVSDVHELVAEGAATGDRTVLQRAILIDPAVGDKDQALRLLDELLGLHLDILPAFAD